MIGAWAKRASINALGWAARQPHPAWQRVARIAAGGQARLQGSEFARRTSAMMVGTVLGQAMSVLLAPLLTRLYAPGEFAALSVYMSVISIPAVAGAMCYEIAIPTANDEKAAASLLAVCLVSLVVTTGAAALICGFLPTHVLLVLGVDKLAYIRVLIPVGFVFISAYSIFLYYAIWAQDFTTIAQTRLSQGVSGPASQILLGLLHGGAPGLCLGFAIGQSSGTLLLCKRAVLPRIQALRGLSLADLRGAARRHRAFPMISSWALTVDAAGNGLLVYILVASFYPGPLAGFLFLAERVIGRPLLMLSTSMLLVFTAEMGRTMGIDPAGLKRRFLQVLARQFAFGGAWVVAINTLCLLAFPVLFGRQWGQAVPYLLPLSVAYLFVNVVISVGHTLQLLGRQRFAALWQVGRVAALIAGFALCARHHATGQQAILTYACIQSVSCVIVLLMMVTSLDRHRLSTELRSA